MADRIEDGVVGLLPAFPVPGDQMHPQMNGMTLRDWFAGKLYPLAYEDAVRRAPKQMTVDELAAKLSYAKADAMLSARQKGGA